MSLEEKLAKIKSLNLQSQQHTAVVLTSIEETLVENGTKFTATAYFAALLALLKQSTTNTSAKQNTDVLISTVYLLDNVVSHVSPALLQSQFNSIFALLSLYLSPNEANAPLLRSSIGCLESLLAAQDAAAWRLPQTQTSPRQAVVALLSLAIDGRPKVRKRAQEALSHVLVHRPPGPAIDHPAAELCALAAQNNLKHAVEEVQNARRQKGRPVDDNEPALIHALQLTKIIARASGGWPSKKIETLSELLLSISRSRNEFLVMSAFEVFEVIFTGMQDEVASSKLPRLLEAIIELKPAQNDSQLIPSWITILSRGYGAAGKVEPEDTFAKLPELVNLVSSFLTSSSHNIRVSTSECLISFFANCVPNSAILDPSVYDEKILQQIADRALDLLTLKYQSAWMEVFTALCALFDALKWRGDPYLLAVIKTIGELRGNEGFQGKKQADEVLGHAIRNIGPRSFLNILPHNLIKPQRGQPGRAWLLPLIRDYVSNTKIEHFKGDMVQLSEAMYQRVIDHGTAEKTMDIKVFETVVQQVWATFPGYCDLPIDLQMAFDQKFAELLSNLLYNHIDLRVDVCRGLQNLVESNQAVIISELPDEVLLFERRMRKADAEKNINHLAQFASNMLAVLFNVYSQTLPHSRAYILQCINAYLSITPEKDMIETFERVGKMLESELPAPTAATSKKASQQSSKDKMPPTSHMLLDLIIALSIYLPRSRFGALFSIASSILTNPAIIQSDPQLIKKAYKLIPRLASSPTGAEALSSRIAELQALFLTTADKTPVPSRRDRLLAIQSLINFLPATDLHFMPSIISEVVLACKDTNEKARNAGFDLLINLANKICDPQNPPGTVIRNRLVPHMPEDAADAPATLEEVFTMTSAGLAGVAPHMIAASITALGRLLFEFHERLEETYRGELVDTVAMFLQSNNREIVRSVLGFVKIIVVVLPPKTLEPRMKMIVPGLMVWSKENKGRMRVKVKGIIDRCLRKFDAQTVEKWVGNEDRKMIVNIRKRRERTKRKKQGVAEDEEVDNADDPKYDNEFDEAVYGSEDDPSELEGESGDDDEAMSGISFKGSGRQRDQFIRDDDADEEPLDLLDPKSMASISSKKTAKTKAVKKTKAKLNEDGKLVFGYDQEDDDVLMDNDKKGATGAVNAYLDAVDGPDAIQRGQRGRLKVKSGQKRGQTADVMDLDEDDARQVAKKVAQSPKMQRKGLGVEKKKGGPGLGNTERRIQKQFKPRHGLNARRGHGRRDAKFGKQKR